MKTARKPFKRKPYIARTPTLRANGEARQRDGAIDGRTNEAIVKLLENALRVAASYKEAAVYAGISESTFHRWMAEGEHAREGTPARVFLERMRKAENEPMMRSLVTIAKDESVETAKWFVSRRNPRFAQAIKVGGDGGEPIKLEGEQKVTLSGKAAISGIRELLKKYPELVNS